MSFLMNCIVNSSSSLVSGSFSSSCILFCHLSCFQASDMRFRFIFSRNARSSMASHSSFHGISSSFSWILVAFHRFSTDLRAIFIHFHQVSILAHGRCTAARPGSRPAAPDSPLATARRSKAWRAADGRHAAPQRLAARCAGSLRARAPALAALRTPRTPSFFLIYHHLSSIFEGKGHLSEPKQVPKSS